MQALLDIILPVFLVVGFGYLVAWRGLLSAASIDGLMSFTQNVAIPCLLFRAIWTLDLGDSFSVPLLISFYTGSLTCFVVGLFGARYLFNRDWEDAVAIGFTCLFANSVLLGLAITERAFGPDALSANYAIIALHSPLCYGLGITTMEFVRARAAGQPNRNLPMIVAKAMFRNALVIGIAIGAMFNVFNVTLPAPFTDALDMMVRTALPAALFAMGGVLFRYRPEGDMRIILFVCAISLLLHPAITWTLGTSFDLDDSAFRSAVLTAAMAPGVNCYVFANIYGRARRVVASSVLMASALSVISAWFWLGTLP
ncbi:MULTISPECIES: AEC family transporter [Marivita]|uniref:AEC family transporter n=1 Tax=Marivita cryptomonadis TaxID=505252 RepID=A0A9Q2P996_9RHOB|nr:MULTISPECIES: AEC family transporter [Marivita]MCR9167990.1 AEC family transporter [Paracoccaceae bacterium]MBM2321370.1 AEC family transporter [Marivita cryptomonadis]MBM2330951.1 AEC family transporter [Marivita cryptomonadis]MBM2340537.1 AEC family transporter [Marivita cryptomonadis]MBM2345199.1 AEC family transporter [Marivita cryptomonadis]